MSMRYQGFDLKRPGRKILASSLLFSCLGLLATAASAQVQVQLPELAKPSTVTGAATTARFFAGVSADNYVSFGTSFGGDQALGIFAGIQVETDHVNTVGNIYLLIQLDEEFFMRRESGEYVIWDMTLANLQAILPGRTLRAREPLTILENVPLGSAGLAGASLRIFLVYDTSAAPDEFYYSGVPLTFGIEAEATKQIGGLSAQLLTGKMVAIPGGSFIMGDRSYRGDDDEQPLHRVRISPFQMGAHEVTVGQFRAFIEDSGYDAGNFWRSPGFVQVDSHPVGGVNYNDVQVFIRWLNRKTGGYYRLPTEAEWEYAARSGSETEYHFGILEADLCVYANGADTGSWNGGYNCSDGYKYTAPVGSFKPNQFGLYDMHGNVWEWVQDWYGSDYYANSPVNNPQGPDSGRGRVDRGGGWGSNAGYLRSANRDNDSPGGRGNSLGFRLVRQP